MPLYPRPQIPLSQPLATFPCGDAARPQAGFSTSGLDPLTCPPAAAPLGQATFATRSQKPRLHGNQPRSGAPPPLPCAPSAVRSRMRNSIHTRARTHAHPASRRTLFPGLREAPAKGSCGRHRKSYGQTCILSVRATKIERLKDTSPRRRQNLRLSALSKGICRTNDAVTIPWWRFLCSDQSQGALSCHSVLNSHLSQDALNCREWLRPAPPSDVRG